jgi:M6 family metalloprotease-like protein
MKRAIFFGMSFLLSLLSFTLFAVPANPDPVEYSLPDGSIIRIVLKGDENVQWAESADGFSLLMNTKGFFEYAVKSSTGEMVLSGIIAKDQQMRSSSDNQFLLKQEKHLVFSEDQVQLRKSLATVSTGAVESTFPTTGDRKLLCILMQFTDKSFTKSKTEFQNLFNQTGYTAEGAVGSVREYYQENSYDQLNLTTTVVGPFTADHNMAYYGRENTDVYKLIDEAVIKANPSVNYSDYDNDNDGVVDGIYVIFAGYGEESGAGVDAIWSCSGGMYQVLDGKQIKKFACSPELQSNSGTSITRIGVICHEFGHVMGAPDFYDTDYGTGGSCSGTGYWDIMGNGSWLMGGNVPAHHNAYTKTVIYGWATLKNLTSAGTKTMLNAAENADFYRLNTGTTNEFFVLENRQKTGFDAYLYGHGLIIYHVHSGIETAISTKKINTTHPQKMYPVCAGAPVPVPAGTSDYGNINSQECPFPGSLLRTDFTPSTMPAAKAWNGTNVNNITNITENISARSVGFTYLGTLSTTPPSTPGNLRVSVNSESQVTLNWNPSTGNVTGYRVYRNGALILTTTGKTAIITGLSLNTTYNFNVTAYYESIASASAYVSVTMPVIGTPSNVNVTGIASNSCTASWTKPAGTVTGYRIYDSFRGTLLHTTSTTTASITGLTSAQYYAIVVEAYNSAGTSLRSSSVHFWTKLPVTQSISLSSITSNSCNLSWMPVSAGTGYNIYRNNVKINYVPYNAISVTGLSSATNYTFQVTTYDNANPNTESVKSTPVNVLTKPVAPGVLYRSNVTQNSVSLSWTASPGVISGYVLFKNGESCAFTGSPGYTISGLEPCTAYTMGVRAVNATGTSDNMATVTFTTTAPAVPSTPTNFTARYINASIGYVLTWTPSTGYAEGYRIYQHSPAGTPVATTTSSSYRPPVQTPGFTYILSVAAYNCSGESARVTTGFMAPKSADGDSAPGNELILFPNPSGDILNLNLETKFNVEIHDMNGKLVLTKTGQQKSIDISELEHGSYMVRIETGSKTYTRLIIKQ